MADASPKREHNRGWQEIAKQIVCETDGAKVVQLSQELLRALDEQKNDVLAPPVNGNKRIFQIAYNEALLVTRAWLLKSRGYDVISVFGNAQAKRVLTGGEEYRLFIVGHNAPRETREEMVNWLKERFPATRILALNPPYQDKLAGADFNFMMNGPEEWLAVVAHIAA